VQGPVEETGDAPAAVFGVGQAEHVGFAAPAAWAPLALGMLLLAGFGWREHTTRTPLLPLSLLSGRAMQAATITRVLFYRTLAGTYLADEVPFVGVGRVAAASAVRPSV
jgi:hypothetical protein